MKKHIALLGALALLTGCVKDDTDFSGIIEGDGFKPIDIKFDYTPLSETEGAIPADDNDYHENSTFGYHVRIDYSGGTATVSGDTQRVSINVDGAHVTVTSAVSGMEYILSGSSSDGSFKLYGENKYMLTLDGVNLTNPHGAAINNQCGKSLYVVLADGKTNKLADGKEYQMVGIEDMKGAFFSEGQTIFSGKGTLEVTAQGRHGIVSDDYIVFRPGNVINVNCSSGHGVKANDGVSIRGGVLNIGVTAPGAKGINCDMDIDISAGRTTVITSGGIVVDSPEDTSSCSAIKSDTNISISGGVLNCKSEGPGGKGINCKRTDPNDTSTGNISITAATVNVVTTGEKSEASPKGIKADGSVTINGANVYSYSAHSDPVDGKTGFSYSQGYTDLTNTGRLFEIKY